jgi:MYXO-CTERM domain-containing protein
MLRADYVETFEIGDGALRSSILFQFTNANQYLYNINYNDELTGRTAFDFILAEQPDYFAPNIDTFSFGDVLVGLSIGTDSDAGFGTPPDYLDYWHYWTKNDNPAAWDASMIGFSDRALTNGSWDGWVFNSNDAPIPAPAGIAILAGLLRARRRRS